MMNDWEDKDTKRDGKALPIIVAVVAAAIGLMILFSLIAAFL